MPEHDTTQHDPTHPQAHTHPAPSRPGETGRRRGFPARPDRDTPTPPSAQRHPEAAGSVCQCIAPEFCTQHPDHAPLVSAEPAWNRAAPGSPTGRVLPRHTRPAGSLPYRDSPGSVRHAVPEFANLTDHELAEWTRAVLAEHNRRLAQVIHPR